MRIQALLAMLLFLGIFAIAPGQLFAQHSAQNSGDADFYGVHIRENGLLFRYSLPEADSVAVAGEFNNWEPVRLQKSGENGFEGFIPILLEKKNYKYKLIINGIWSPDPLNNRWQYDRSGSRISILTVPASMHIYRENPQKMGENKYRFYLHNREAESVFLVGSFNNFNPYAHPMRQDKNGYWTTTVQVFPGQHFYSFIVDGEWTLDPIRSEVGQNRFGKRFSAFYAH